MPAPELGFFPVLGACSGWDCSRAREHHPAGSDLAREGTQVALGNWKQKKAKCHNKGSSVGTPCCPWALGLALPWMGSGGSAGPSLALVLKFESPGVVH